MKKTSHHLIVTVLLLSSATLCGGIKLSAVFGNHMVLQQGEPVPVWGSSDPEETIKVTFDGQTKSTKADKNGNWMIKLDALKANAKGQDLRVNERTFKDVLIGEVWICSGQSNMAWTVRGSANPQEEAADANYPAIRHIKVPQVPSDRREKTFNASWQVCNPQTAGNFTAVGYYFGRRLHKELKVPIGLINSSWGGTRIEPWIPMEGFELIKEQAFAK
ncbi:MAG: 9-O-acetylesterase, partial [Opitutae bacterium]|nr:9-O-acetylesterase [Opitutae bacterium]